MTVDEIKTLITKDEYDFLRSNKHLGENIMLLTLGGSHAYGTNVETSDVDIRGCAINSKSDLLGLSEFEQVVNTQTDTTIYAFNKLIRLLLNCNPNVIEMLGCKPEHYFYLTDKGKQLIANRKLFLSRRAVKSFGGYATQQLRRLENAIARDRVPQARKEEHILSSMSGVVQSFEARYTKFDKGSIKMYTDKSQRPGLDREIFADISLCHYPARDFNSILNDLKNVLDCYEKIGHRNNKKDEAHLNKHAMHLIRLYLMCLDLLEQEDIITYRENEREMLLSIRNGAYQKEDGTYRQEFFDMVSDYEEKMKYASKHSNLPEQPDMRCVEEFVMDVNMGVIQ